MIHEIQEIAFAKMHGLGNDFVIIDAKLLTTSCDLKHLTLKIADRHLGIGCDQFIAYEKHSDYYKVQVYNQDGSTAKACGNAMRCLSKLIYNNLGEQNINIRVAGREITSQLVSDNTISVNMGEVSFNEQWMPDTEALWGIAGRYAFDPKEMICVDIGNPHLVIFSHLNNQDQEIVGKMLQEHELFPDGINVDFAYIKDNKIYLSVWERGAGFTLACGSGACVSFAAAGKLGFIQSTAEVIFKLGSLTMSKDKEDVIMTGCATLVATGTFYYEQ